MIEHIIFDLDGVLVDAKELHFRAFGQALADLKGIYLSDKQQFELDGLPTKIKLARLGFTNEKEIMEIDKKKQAISSELFNQLTEDKDLAFTLSLLSTRGIKLSVASNSRRNTVVIALKRLGIDQYFSSVQSNDDVVQSKPSPEMYYKCMLEQKIWIPRTMVIEDSDVGAEACVRGGMSVLRVENRSQVTLENIEYGMKCFENVFKDVTE